MAIKTAILNGLDSVRGTKNKGAILKDLRKEPMMMVVDLEVKTKDHEIKLGHLVLQFFERLWEEDLRKVIFEIESDELETKKEAGKERSSRGSRAKSERKPLQRESTTQLS